jgi:hypothetical protein
MVMNTDKSKNDYAIVSSKLIQLIVQFTCPGQKTKTIQWFVPALFNGSD